MKIEFKEQYANMLYKKAEMEHWEITFESEVDNKLCQLFFDGNPKKQKKQKKQKSMESLVYIVFGRNSLDSVLTVGFTSFTKQDK